jgi:hypothetical protein
MPTDPQPEERLEILRKADRFRKWSSLDHERVCVVCERIFSGRQVEIIRDQGGRYLLKCPTDGCPSLVAHWFYVGRAAASAASVLHGLDGQHDFSTQQARAT